jgi:hypothetical protein
MTAILPRAPVEPAALLPPRAVPICVRLAALFGGVLQQIGWLMLGFGMIFFYGFALQSDWSGPMFAMMDTDRATGTVVSVDYTNASENDAPVYKITYSFVAANGRKVEARAYVTGYAPDAGQRLAVTYLRSQPDVARVDGMRRTTFGPLAAIAGIFPLIGAVMVAFGLREGWKANRLLGTGRLAFAKVSTVVPTNTTINNRPVMAVTLTFRAQDGASYEVTSKTNAPERLTDQTEELVLFDPDDPTYGAALDSLPGSPTIDNAGALRLSGSPLICLTVLALPGLTLLGNALYLFFRFTT